MQTFDYDTGEWTEILVSFDLDKGIGNVWIDDRYFDLGDIRVRKLMTMSSPMAEYCLNLIHTYGRGCRLPRGF